VGLETAAAFGGKTGLAEHGLWSVLRICLAAFDRSASLVGQGEVECFAGVDDRLVMDGGDFVQPQLGIAVLGYFVLLHMVFDGLCWSASLMDRAATSKLLTRV
jgi:hypothetical protein